MSYCRWSSDDYSCDVYCYEHVGGYFAVHVAGSRYVFAEPLPEPIYLRKGFTDDEFKAWFARDRKVLDMLNAASMEPIGLAHDGETFEEPDAGAAADRLECLRGLGYRVPQYAIDALREESAEEAGSRGDAK